MKSVPNYKNIEVVFATMHGKEKILQELFKKELGWDFNVPPINTDLFGTFTGEVKRPGDLKETLLLKAKAALDLTNLKFAISSEGSFGPHPSNPFLSCDQETLLFFDLENKISIVSMYLTAQTDFFVSEIKNLEDLNALLNKYDLKNQGFILRVHQKLQSNDSKSSGPTLYKDLNSKNDFIEIYKQVLKFDPKSKVSLETDNRAHKSLKRQAAILEAGKLLIQKLKQNCPSCKWPGYSQSGWDGHLNCSDCGWESEKPSHEIWSCPNSNCVYEKLNLRSDGVTELDPKYCNYCNP